MEFPIASSAPAPRTRSARITERDRELLRFAADQRFVLAEHAQALLGISRNAASARLRVLCRLGLLARHAVFNAQPGAYLVTRAGLGLVGCPLRPASVDLRSYEHDAALVWLALAAGRGSFGRMREVLSERQLRSRDTVIRGADDRESNDGQRPLAVRLGGRGPAGHERLHYPDLMLDTASGHRIAVELELSGKGRVRREKILAGYASDRRIDAVLYLVADKALARQLQSSARKLGISRMVHVQPVQFVGSRADPGGGLTRRRQVSRPAAQAREALR